MAGRFTVETIFKAIDRVTAPVSRMQNRVGKFTRSLTRGLHSADRAASSVMRSFGGLIRSAAKYGAIVSGAVAGAVGLLIGQFAKVENAEAAFTPLLGGAERARRAVEAINQTAASTPFQFDTLAGAVNQLLPVMNGNIEDTIRTVRMLGDTAGGNAQKLDSVTRGYTKAMLKGKVDMESLNMIAEAGVPIFQDLAEVMGTKVGKRFFKQISAGRVTTEQLTKAFEKLTGAGGKFYQGMEIASRTTTGLWSTLKDNISLTAAELGSVLAPTIKDLIRYATGIAQQVRAWVIANRSLIETRFLMFVEQTRGVLKSIGNGLVFIYEHRATIGYITAAVVGLVVVMKTLIAVLTLVNLLMAANPIVLIVLGVVALTAAFAALVYWVDDVVTWFEKLPYVVQVVLAPFELLVRAIKYIKDNWADVMAAGAAVSGFFDEQTTRKEGQGGQASRRKYVNPAERTAALITESRESSTAEVTIRDETNRATVTKGRMGRAVKLQQSGAF